jgi:hypothetical protein
MDCVRFETETDFLFTTERNDLLTNSMEQTLFEKPLIPRLVKNSPPVMESEDLVPCSQVQATFCYPESDKSNPRPAILFL